MLSTVIVKKATCSGLLSVDSSETENKTAHRKAPCSLRSIGDWKDA